MWFIGNFGWQNSGLKDIAVRWNGLYISASSRRGKDFKRKHHCVSDTHKKVETVLSLLLFGLWSFTFILLASVFWPLSSPKATKKALGFDNTERH